MKKTADFRNEVAKAFLESINDNPRNWKKGWFTGVLSRAVNAVTNKPYKGLNLFYLKLIEKEKGFTDSRWATFKQIVDNGWKLEKGSKGYKVEYWYPLKFDKQTKKRIPISWSEYAKLTEEEKNDCTFKAKYFTVFNASQIEGVPELIANHNEISGSDVIQKISNGIDVPIEHTGGDWAYYSVEEDKIFLPEKEAFDDEYAYNSTALHELGHSTGAKSRLDRNFSRETYAYEELVAEITSCFMGEYVEAEMTESNFENHKAYIASWAREIEDSSNYLVNAIKDAEKAADYMIEKGELVNSLEIKKEKSISIDINRVDFAKRYEKFGIRLAESLDIKALDSSGLWPTWITKDGKCLGNTDQLNIWLCDRNAADNNYVSPSIDELKKLFEEINLRLPEDKQLSIIDCVDKEDLQELEGGAAFLYLKTNIDLKNIACENQIDNFKIEKIDNENVIDEEL